MDLFSIIRTNQSLSHHQRNNPKRLKGRRRLFIEQLEERKLLAAGGLDTSFRGGAIVTSTALHNYATDLAVQSDGKTVVVGSIQRDTAGDYDFYVARFLADGKDDTTFGVEKGYVIIPFDLGGDKADIAKAVAIQPDGKIVVAGTVTSRSGDTDMGVVRLNTNGTLDYTFDRDARQTIAFNRGPAGSRNDRATDVAMSGSKIVLVGSSQYTSTGDYDFAFARLLSNGSLDTTLSGDGKNTVSLNLGGTRLDEAYGVAVQGDGKIVAVGSAQKSTTDTQAVVMRLKTNGSLDTTFGQGGKVVQGGSLFDRATGVVIQSNGRIVVGGYSQMTSAGDYDFRVSRYLVTGAMDTTFSSDGTTTVSFNLGQQKRDFANGVALQSDGKILITGNVQRATTGDTAMGIARLTATGSLDTKFGSSGRAVVSIPYSVGYNIKVKPNGRIVAAGYAWNRNSGKYASVVVQVFAS